MSQGAAKWQRAGDMTTSRLPWPRDAAEARDTAAEAANEIVLLLSQVLDGETQDLDRVIGRCLSRAHNICRLLEREGAQTVPPR